MDFEKAGKKIETLYHATWDNRILIQKKYSWQENDARLTIFNKLSAVLQSVDIGYLLIHLYLQKKAWWKKYEQLNVNEVSIKNTIEEFEMFFRIGLIQNLLYSIESSFRIFVVAMNQSACNQGLSEFKSIYDWLLKHLDLKIHMSLLDLWRNIRNVMHNNGIFMPTNKKDQTIKYKSTYYNFKIGKPIDFLTTDLLINNLIPDLLKIVEDVVVASPLKDIKYIPEKT
jgi:hypothetical protein